MAKKKILLVDDDAELCSELAETLEAEGYSVDAATDGAAGIKLIQKKAHDIYLLDFKMQEMTGIDVLKEIKKAGRKAAIFFVSGRPGLEAVLKAEKLSDSINGIIEKPFELQFLLEKLRTC